MGQEDLTRGAFARRGRLKTAAGILVCASFLASAHAEMPAGVASRPFEAADGASPRALTYLRLESAEAVIRLSLPAPERWREIRLEHPPRFVLDLEEVESRLPLAPTLYETRFELGPLRGLRTSQLSGPPGARVVRVVLEFDHPVSCRVESASDELIVEFAAEGAPPQIRELTTTGWSLPESREDPTTPDPLAAADLLFRRGEWASADAAYTACLADAPDAEDGAWALFQLGNCRWIRGDQEAAREAYALLGLSRPWSIWTRPAGACLEVR